MEKQALKVLGELMIDRGYKIDYIKDDTKNDKNDKNDKEEENKGDDSFSLKGSKSDNIILCFINNDEKLNIQGIKDRISVMNKEGATSCIIVYRSSVTSSAKKSLETLEYDFELFGLHELQLNITRHRLVPRHCRVLSSEKEELDKAYKGKLPILLSTDPISRYYSFKKGEYIRITRKNGEIIYRVVK